MSNPIEKTVAKGAGKLAAVKARGKGLRGVFTKLSEQHSEVSSLLARLHTMSDATKKRELWLDVRRQLLSHERAEIAVVYPALMLIDEANGIVSQHALEAGRIELAISELDRVSVEAPAWKPALDRLAGMVTGHASEEETELFPRAQSLLGEENAAALEAAFTEAQAREAAEIR
jgi:hemerythrin superfamily protein